MILIAFTGNSLAATDNDINEGYKYTNAILQKNTTFDFEQSVQGNGYFMTYIYAKAGNTAVKNYAHGSGSLNSESLLTLQDMDRLTHDANAVCTALLSAVVYARSYQDFFTTICFAKLNNNSESFLICFNKDS